MDIKAKERKDIATALGINEQYLYQCLDGRRDMSAENATRLEVATGGRIKRSMVNRKWREIWPELATSPAAITAKKRVKT